MDLCCAKDWTGDNRGRVRENIGEWRELGTLKPDSRGRPINDISGQGNSWSKILKTGNPMGQAEDREQRSLGRGHRGARQWAVD